MSLKTLRGFLPIENRKRLVFLSLSMIFLFCLLLVRFYRIQIVEGDKWLKKARSQHQLTLVEPCKRGSFYSNTDLKEGHKECLVAFALDIPKFHLYADVSILQEEHKKIIAEKVSTSLQLDFL